MELRFDISSEKNKHQARDSVQQRSLHREAPGQAAASHLHSGLSQLTDQQHQGGYLKQQRDQLQRMNSSVNLVLPLYEQGAVVAMGAAVTKHTDHTPPELNPNYEAFVCLDSQAEQRTEDSFATSSLCCSATVLTMSSSVSRVILKMSPCSVWARKKNMDLVLCVAEQTKIIPLSGSSKSFCQESTQESLVED